MSLPNIRRILAASASTSLVAITLLVAPVNAGDTRLIYIGNPPPGPTDNWTQNNGFLTNQTQTHPGGLTAVVVEIKNDGGQTINHASLLGGDPADNAAKNCLFPPPGVTTDQCNAGDFSTALPSLGAGLSFAQAYTDDGTCDPVTATSLDCNLGTFAAYQAKHVTVVFQTSGADPSTFSYWLGAYLAESNSTGSNQDNFYAIGSVSTTSATCAANTDANYFLPDSSVLLATLDCRSTAGATTTAMISSQDMLIATNGKSLASHGAASLSIGGKTTQCASFGLDCPYDAVVANVLDGGEFTNGLQWTITWFGTRSVSGVIHFGDNYPTDPTDFAVITFDKKSQCATPTSVNCWVPPTTKSAGNASPVWFTAVIRTPDNGLAYGFK